MDVICSKYMLKPCLLVLLCGSTRVMERIIKHAILYYEGFASWDKWVPFQCPGIESWVQYSKCTMSWNTWMCVLRGTERIFFHHIVSFGPLHENVNLSPIPPFFNC